MILISHRGNLSGINPQRENDPKYIQEALDKGFYVEIDIISKSDGFYFGHELGGPSYPIDWKFLVDNNKKLLIHCKDLESLVAMRENLSGANLFFHDREDYVMSSKGWIIAHSRIGEFLSCSKEKDVEKTILMRPEKHGLGKNLVEHCMGVCSDIIEFYA